MRSLHDYIKVMRGKEAAFAEANPSLHPVELYKAMAQAVVKMIQDDGLSCVTVHPAVFNGGIPEYTYAIAHLKEAGIQVISENQKIASIEVK